MPVEKCAWIVVLLLAVSACGANLTQITACDLNHPSKHADERVRLIGEVFQQADRTYRLEADCVPSDRPYMQAKTASMPLVWLAGERWPEGITREGESEKFPDVIGGGHVTGTLQQANGRWFFKAEDYARPVWEL